MVRWYRYKGELSWLFGEHKLVESFWENNSIIHLKRLKNCQFPGPEILLPNPELGPENPLKVHGN